MCSEYRQGWLYASFLFAKWYSRSPIVVAQLPLLELSNAILWGAADFERLFPHPPAVPCVMFHVVPED